MKSLAHIFRDMVHHRERAEKSRVSDDSEQAHYLPLSEQARNQQAPTHPTAQNPSEQEMRDYLTSLARAYDLPTDFVHSVAKTENHFHLDDHTNPAHKDKHGRRVPVTIDYGLS